MSAYATDDEHSYGDIPDENLSNEQLRAMLDQESQLTMKGTGARSPDSRDSLDQLYGTYKNQSQTPASQVSQYSNRSQPFPLTALTSNNSTASQLSNKSNTNTPKQQTTTPNPNRATTMTKFGNRDGFNPHNLGQRGSSRKIANMAASGTSDLNKFTIPNNTSNISVNNSNNAASNDSTPVPMDIVAAQPLRVKDNVNVTPYHKNVKFNTSTAQHRNNNNNNRNDGDGDDLTQRISKIAGQIHMPMDEVVTGHNRNGVQTTKLKDSNTQQQYNHGKHRKDDSKSSNRQHTTQEYEYYDDRRSTAVSQASTIYDRESTIVRSSTSGTTITTLKNQLSFAKLDVLNEKNQNGPTTTKSALSAAMEKKMGGKDAALSDSSASKQFKDDEGNLVIQQLPFNQKKMFKCNLYLGISEDDVVPCIVFFDKKFTGADFINFIKKEFNHGALQTATVELWVADEDGDLDDDYPQPDTNDVLSKMGLSNFFLQITDIDKQQRQTIATDVRQSIANLEAVSNLPSVDPSLPDHLNLDVDVNASLDENLREHVPPRPAPGCCVVL